MTTPRTIRKMEEAEALKNAPVEQETSCRAYPVVFNITKNTPFFWPVHEGIYVRKISIWATGPCEVKLEVLGGSGEGMFVKADNEVRPVHLSLPVAGKVVKVSTQDDVTCAVSVLLRG